MSPRIRLCFLLLGLAGIAAMVWTLGSDTHTLCTSLRQAGLRVPAIIALWGCIYMMNALAWQLIIQGGEAQSPVRYWQVYRLTLSSFALNNVTPVGLMGSEPFRLMTLSPLLGASRAASAVILYTLTHIFSHFLFWLFSIALFVCLRPVDLATGLLLAITALLCLTGVWLFMRVYRSGMAAGAVHLLSRLPLVGPRAQSFAHHHAQTLGRIDQMVAALHSQRRTTFYAALSLEFAARVVSCAEIYIVMRAFTPSVGFAHCILMVAFTSLFANLLFFSPMQLGTREGGYVLSTGGLALPAAYGIYTSLITRVRELFWTALGILLMKIDHHKP